MEEAKAEFSTTRGHNGAEIGQTVGENERARRRGLGIWLVSWSSLGDSHGAMANWIGWS